MAAGETSLLAECSRRLAQKKVSGERSRVLALLQLWRGAMPQRINVKANQALSTKLEVAID